MASKVNVKFVTILSIALVVFAGVVGGAGYLLVFKSGAEHAKIGDRLAAEGSWEQARRSYSKAVNKEPTVPEYLEKWALSIRSVTPTSETEYRDRLLNDLYQAYLQLSVVKPTDPDAQTQLLDFMFMQFQLGTSTVPRTTGVVNRATISISRFESNPPAENTWKTLYRFRGLPLASAMNAGENLEEPALSQTKSDLEQALIGDPSDEMSAVALAWWHAAIARDQQNSGRIDPSIASLAQAVQVLDGFLESNPVSPQAMLERAIRSNQIAVAEATRGMRADDTRSTQTEMQSNLGLELPEILDTMLSADPDAINPNLVLMFARVEMLSLPDNRLALSQQIAAHLSETRPDDARILSVCAEIDERRADQASALARYEHLATLENLPVSLKGFIRVNLRREGKYNRARIRLEQIMFDPDREDRAEAMEQATSDRRDFAQQVSEDEPKLLMLDGMIAQCNDDLTGARDLYRRYNEQTLSSDPVGLWRQVQTAMDLGFITEAENLLTRMLEIQPGNRTAALAMAEVQYRLNKFETSLRLFESMGELDPGNQVIQDRIQLIRIKVRPDDVSNNPIMVAKSQGQILRNGTPEQPGNLEQAAEFLQSQIEIHGHDEMLAIDLIQIYLDLSQIGDARAVANAAAEANPGNTMLDRFRVALESDSVVDALITLIEQSDRSEIGKSITKYRVYLAQDEVDAALEELEHAITIEPENPDLVEVRFDNAIGTNDIPVAEEMTEIATRLNLDRANGVLYRARLLSKKGLHDQAVQLLEQAIAQGKTFPMTFRILASEYTQQRQFDLAISTLEQALALNEENPPTQLQHIRLLAAAGRTGDALQAARRALDSGNPPSYITDAWLELEAIIGGDAGRSAAIVRRESIRNLEPDNLLNNASLAELYILVRRFEEARPVIVELRDSNDRLALVMLDMRWHADQGRLLIDGSPVDGLIAAQRLFQDYLLFQEESEITAETYLAYARFMIGRDQLDLALPAIEMAREIQTEDTLEADKLLGDLYYSRGRFGEAVEIFESILENGTDTEDESYRKRLVESLIRVNRFEDALTNLELVETSDLTVMLQRSEILFGLDRNSEARSILDQTVQKYPENPLVYVRRAEANLGEEALAGDVLADLEAALRVDPNNWRALRLRGVLQWNEGRRDQAINDIRAAVAANPQLEQLLYGLMNELITIGRDGQAADIADGVIEARPTDAQLMLNCARVFANHEVWERAAEYTRQAWVQSKNPQVGVLLIDSLVRLDPPRSAQAEAIFDDLVTLVPGAADTMLMLMTEATVRNAQGRQNSTVRLITKALVQIEENPGEVLTWSQHINRIFRNEPVEAARIMKIVAEDTHSQLSELMQGWVQLVTAQQFVSDPSGIEEGVLMMRKLRDRDDTDPLSRLAYRIEGTTRFSESKFDEAAQIWSDGIARFPEDWEMLNNLAYLYGSELDRAAEGLPLSEKAMQIAPEQLSTFDTLALLYTNLGRYDEAHSTLDLASALASTTAETVSISIARIRLHLAQGEFSQARKISTDTRSVVFGSVELGEVITTLDEFDAQIDSASP